MSWTFVVDFCHGFLSWIFVVDFCRGCLSWIFVVDFCRGFLSWICVVDFCRDFLSWIFCRGFLSWIFGVDVCRGLFEPTNYFIFLIFLDGFFSKSPSEVEPLPRLSKEPLTDCAIRTCFFIAEMSDSLCAPVQRAASPRNQSGGTRLKNSKASLGQNSGHSIQRG